MLLALVRKTQEENTQLKMALREVQTQLLAMRAQHKAALSAPQACARTRSHAPTRAHINARRGGTTISE